MDVRLVPLNAFIALTSPRTTSWPNPLYEIGYRLEALEVPHGPPDARIVVDGVAFKAAESRFLAAEGKSGANVENDQAQRYGALDAAELVRMTGTTLTSPSAPTASPLYVCLEENLERILLGLSEAGCDFPVLAVGDAGLSLHGGTPADAAVAAAFAAPIALPGPPPLLVRVDEGSTDHEFDKVVAGALVAEASQGKQLISDRELASRALPYLHLFGTGIRNRLVKRIAASAGRLAAASADTFEFKQPTASRDYSVIKVLDSPERADPRGRTQRFQALRARLEGRELEQVVDEPTLFDEIDVAAELDKADTGGPDDEPDDERREGDP